VSLAGSVSPGPARPRSWRSSAGQSLRRSGVEPDRCSDRDGCGPAQRRPLPPVAYTF